jgi:hypothetical protein
MSAIADGALSVSRPMTISADYVQIPLLGGLWVLVNVGLGALGVRLGWPITCAFTAGLLNGTLLAVIAVATASARIQASATGLLGGLTLSGRRSDGSMVWKATQSLHAFVDNASNALGIPVNEKLHQVIEQEVLYMVWTIVFVVMASLVAEWVRAVRAKG